MQKEYNDIYVDASRSYCGVAVSHGVPVNSRRGEGVRERKSGYSNTRKLAKVCEVLKTKARKSLARARRCLSRLTSYVYRQRVELRARNRAERARILLQKERARLHVEEVLRQQQVQLWLDNLKRQDEQVLAERAAYYDQLYKQEQQRDADAKRADAVQSVLRARVAQNISRWRSRKRMPFATPTPGSHDITTASYCSYDGIYYHCMQCTCFDSDDYDPSMPPTTSTANTTWPPDDVMTALACGLSPPLTTTEELAIEEAWAQTVDTTIDLDVNLSQPPSTHGVVITLKANPSASASFSTKASPYTTKKTVSTFIRSVLPDHPLTPGCCQRHLQPITVAREPVVGDKCFSSQTVAYRAVTATTSTATRSRSNRTPYCRCTGADRDPTCDASLHTTTTLQICPYSCQPDEPPTVWCKTCRSNGRVIRGSQP